MKPAFLIAGLSIFAHAFHIPVRPRAESCDEATAGEMAEGDDGPKTDGTTGIGVEFECPQLQIHPKDTENTPFNAKDGLKGRTIVGRQGDRFKLTVDGSGMANLQMEYILDGTAIKLGTGDADKVGAAAAQDLVSLLPMFSFDCLIKYPTKTLSVLFFEHLPILNTCTGLLLTSIGDLEALEPHERR